MKNYMDHDPDCVLKSSKLTKANHRIEDSEYLITAIKETDLSTIQKSGLDIAMLLSTLGIQRFDVNKYTLNRSIAKLRVNFTIEIPNYYKMLVPYLKKYCILEETASCVVQADENNCFYRVVISIPNASMVFKIFCVPVYYIDATFYQSCHYD